MHVPSYESRSTKPATRNRTNSRILKKWNNIHYIKQDKKNVNSTAELELKEFKILNSIHYTKQYKKKCNLTAELKLKEFKILNNIHYTKQYKKKGNLTAELELENCV